MRHCRRARVSSDSCGPLVTLLSLFLPVGVCQQRTGETDTPMRTARIGSTNAGLRSHRACGRPIPARGWGGTAPRLGRLFRHADARFTVARPATKDRDMRLTLMTCLLMCVCGGPLAAQEAKLPRWDAREVGPLARMGITSLDVSDDGKEIAVGTIAPFGDPNVIVLSEAGKIVRQYKVGQQWIDSVAFVAGTADLLAVCTMPAGKAGDRVEIFRCQGDRVVAEKTPHEGAWFFNYGDHSNHPTLKLARAKNATAVLAGNQLVVYRKDKEPTTLRVPISDPDASVSLAVDESGWAVVGTTTRESAPSSNLHLFDPDQKKPVWSRAANTDVGKAPTLEKGQYGTPTLPDGTRKELAQRDEKVWAPLSVAIHANGGRRLIAVADYQGWQRWVRSSATMKEDNQGLRFMPAKPTVTVYDETGRVVQRLAADEFQSAFWCDMQFAEDGKKLVVWPHSWKCRGLAGQSILPADDRADTLYLLDVASGKAVTRSFRPAVSDVAVSGKGALA